MLTYARLIYAFKKKKMLVVFCVVRIMVEVVESLILELDAQFFE
jgi:hypothetical protein